MIIPLLFQYWRLRRNEKFSVKDLQRLQFNRFKSISTYAYHHSPFYRNKFDQAGITPRDIRVKEDIIRIPVTTKEELISAKNDIFARNYNEQNCFSSRTSGSTGQPFTSYFDRDAWYILKYASKLRARHACGIKTGNRMVNIDACTVSEANQKNSVASKSLMDVILKKRMLSVYDDFENHMAFYKTFKPNALYGFGTYFNEFINYIENNNIKWHHKPELIFTSAEMLSQAIREKIESYFGHRVYDIYGSTELKEVAWECPSKEGYHINEDLCYVEIIDKNEDQNNVGEIVITSLVNKGMPLIRYNLKDHGCFIMRQCSCGRPFKLIKPTYGRDADIFRLENGKRIFPYELTMAMEGIPGIFQYQIIQEDCKNIRLKIKPDKDWIEGNCGVIKGRMKKILTSNVNVAFQLTDNIDREPNGKFKVIKSIMV